MEDQKQEVGFIKYSGAATEDGVMDAGSAGIALLGIDQSFRYFNSRQSSVLAKLNYDIPVRIQRGSWEAVILTTAIAAGGLFAASYVKKAAEKLAENDFKDIGLKDVFTHSIKAIQNYARLVNHTGQIKDWIRGRLIVGNNLNYVEILNKRQDVLLIPLDYLSWYQSMPRDLLLGVIDNIREDRILSIGVKTDSGTDEYFVKNDEKVNFEEAKDPEEEERIFPELTHGRIVTLEGKLIRGNEASNSLGLEYRGRVLNCVPAQGNIKKYKTALFLHCLVSGRISRHERDRFVEDRKPTIVVSSVSPLERDDDQLFVG